MEQSTLISVVIPIFNAENYLNEALDSLINQSFKQFEIVAINDGSTDGSGAILEDYASNDSRVRIYSQNNRGIVASLNFGCKLSRGIYIARMDADDMCRQDRLEMQFSFLQKKTMVGMVGSWVEYIGPEGESRGIWKVPTSPTMVDWRLHFGTSIAHPSVMIRKNVIEKLGYYRNDQLPEDYDLWVRASKITQLANIDHSLISRRIHNSNISHYLPQYKEPAVVSVMKQKIEMLMDSDLNISKVSNLRQCLNNPKKCMPQQLIQATTFLVNIYRAFLRKNDLGWLQFLEVANDMCTMFTRIQTSYNYSKKQRIQNRLANNIFIYKIGILENYKRRTLNSNSSRKDQWMCQ